mmetsp:Transcript_91358/g.164985  ORF Transcript_91358/g.164985 Transcript_91358/m.164985 type:complete len:504 (+) Transcript_91358:2919-4430(+)
MRVKQELHFGPLSGKLLQGVFHLLLLLCLVCSVFHSIWELLELQVPHIAKEDVWRHNDLLPTELHKLRPVPVSHCWVSQLADQRAENSPLLNDVLHANVAIRLPVYFHILQLFEEVLDLIFHLACNNIAPLNNEEAFSDLDAIDFKFPQTPAVCYIFTHGRHRFLGVAQLLRVREVRGNVQQILQLLVEAVEVVGDIPEPLHGKFEAALVVVVRLLSESTLVGLQLGVELGDLLPVQVALLGNQWLNLLLLGHDVVLQLVDVRSNLLQLLELLVAGKSFSLELGQGLHNLVLAQEKGVLLVVHVFDVIHHLDQVHDVSLLELGLTASAGGLVELIQAFQGACNPGCNEWARMLIGTILGHLREGWLVGRTADWPWLAVLVNQLHMDDELALVSYVGDLRLAVVEVQQLKGQIAEDFLALGVLHALLHGDKELITTRLPVLSVLVPRLDEETSLHARLLLLKHAWTKAERFLSDGVEEERVVGHGGCEITRANLNLNLALPGSN